MQTQAPTIPADFALDQLLGYRIQRLAGAIGALAEREAGEIAGVTLAEYRLMLALFTDGPSGVSALQRTLLLDKAWISRTLTQLTGKALAQADSDPLDARRVIFSLTPRGRRSARRLIARAIRRQKSLLAGFSAPEAQQFAGYLARVEDNASTAARAPAERSRGARAAR
jgi:DNA-binding MarR family transcriptional regulator